MDLLGRHFDTAFDAPDGIKKLRELILTLAMQGKLVPQDLCDPPASQLLKEIEAEKRRLVKQGKIMEPKQLAPVNIEKMPYALPKGWEWVRLGAIAEYNGRDNANPKDIEKDSWVLDLEDIEKTTSRLLYRAKYSERESKSTKSRFEPGDVLYGKLRPYLDKVIVADREGVCTTELVPIVPSKAVVAHYLRWALKSPSFLGYVNDLMYGVKMPRLGTDSAINSVHPLPPVNEQRRIVAKIDELMARCDALEKLRAARDAKRLAVHTAAVRQLLNVADTDGHIQAREFLGQHFGELYTVKENVTELRKAILQLAVMGKLVAQDPDDPPASELLKKIDAERKRLIKEGKIRAPKPLAPIATDEIPLTLPKSWDWAHISDLAESIDYGTSQKTVDDPSLVAVYRMGNIVNGKLVDEGFKYIRPEIDELPHLFLKSGDILFNRTNSFELVGKSALYLGLDNQSTFASYLIRVRLFKKHVSPAFVSMAMNAPYFRQTQIEPEIVQQCGQANFNGTKLSLCAVPTPPLPEQHRIIAKVDQLMSICDTIEQGIENTRKTQSSLLDAVMAQYGSQRCA